MDLTPDNIRALRTQVYTNWRQGYGSVETFWQKLAMRVSSSTSQNDYAWMADLPKMREWLGSRTIHNLSTHSYALKNKTFELTLGIKREHIEDDNLGVYASMAEVYGKSVAQHRDELTATLLQTGHAVICFDGQNFFDTDHPVNPFDAAMLTYQNYWSSGKALTQANFLIQRAIMAGYVGETGKPVKARATMLVVPPALEGAAIEIVVNERTANGSSNTTRGMTDYMVIDDLAGEDTTWYLMDLSKPIKPLLMQVRREPTFVTKNRIDDDVVLEDNEVRFYSDDRKNVGVTLPFLAQKMVA